MAWRFGRLPGMTVQSHGKCTRLSWHGVLLSGQTNQYFAVLFVRPSEGSTQSPLFLEILRAQSVSSPNTGNGF